MILALGDYTGPTPVYDYSGRLVDPNVAATAADCLPFQCGAQSSNLAAKLWCAFWGQAGVRSSCTDPACGPYRPSYCTPSQSPAVAVASPVAPVNKTSQTTQAAAPVVTVDTPTGPVVAPANAVPAITDVQLTPAQVRIPNIWDSLDPAKLSQFEYVGISTSFPPWISKQYRDSLAPIPQAAGGFSLEGGSIPWWVYVAIAAAMYGFSNHRRQARRRRKVLHG